MLNFKKLSFYANLAILSLFFIACSSNIPTPNERKQTAINLSSINKNAVVTQIASKRDDVNSITTIAGNLDIDEWTKIQKITPLDGSLNPVNYIKKLENIKQYHLLGTNDTVVPKEVFFSYLNKFEDKSNI